MQFFLRVSLHTYDGVLRVLGLRRESVVSLKNPTLIQTSPTENDDPDPVPTGSLSNPETRRTPSYINTAGSHYYRSVIGSFNLQSVMI